ncbi:MAG: flagellar motor switch protein FliN [Bdellovibrionales bacterium]|nr:flagellar motor switch protein FliN [Bdellovibrionales bacterium]
MSDDQEAYAKAMEAANNSLNFVSDIELNIGVELGRTEIQIEKVLNLKKGNVLEVNKLSGEPLDVRSNGRLVARGEAVIVNEKFGIRITQIVSPEGSDDIY